MAKPLQPSELVNRLKNRATVRREHTLRVGVLVVDDDRYTVELLTAVLHQAGCRIWSAMDGEEAMEIYRLIRPDAVLLDIAMPGVDGMTALDEILKIDPDARIAMVSGTNRPAVVQESIEAGARDFILKPFDIGTVVRCVENLVA